MYRYLPWRLALCQCPGGGVCVTLDLILNAPVCGTLVTRVTTGDAGDLTFQAAEAAELLIARELIPTVLRLTHGLRAVSGRLAAVCPLACSSPTVRKGVL